MRQVTENPINNRSYVTRISKTGKNRVYSIERACARSYREEPLPKSVPKTEPKSAPIRLDEIEELFRQHNRSLVQLLTTRLGSPQAASTAKRGHPLFDLAKLSD